MKYNYTTLPFLFPPLTHQATPPQTPYLYPPYSNVDSFFVLKAYTYHQQNRLNVCVYVHMQTHIFALVICCNNNQ